MTFTAGQSGNPATQFQPGQSGNPAGRPIRPSAEALNKVLNMDFAKLPKRLQQKIRDMYGDCILKEAIAMRMAENALDGGNVSNAAHKEIFDRIEGKSTEHVDLTVPNLPLTDEGDLSRRIVAIVAGLLQSGQGSGLTPPEHKPQGEPTNEHQTSTGGVSAGGSSAGR